MSWCCRLTEMELRRPKNLYRSRKWLWYTVVWNYKERKRSKTSAPPGAVVGADRPDRLRRRVPARGTPRGYPAGGSAPAVSHPWKHVSNMRGKLLYGATKGS